MANKRIMKELNDITTSPPQGCKVKLANDNDLNLWDITMDGPSESVYSGGKFHLQISLPREYPFKPPLLTFLTKIYHPNVTNDERGAMCLGMLRADSWKPPNKIAEVLKLVRAVLVSPQPDDAVEGGIAEEFKGNFKGFEKTAREWVRKYAK